MLSTNSFAQIMQSEESYKYPNLTSLESTIAATSIGVPNDASWLYLKLTPLDRYIEGDQAYVKARLYSPKPHCKNRNKNLIFIQPGVGSSSSVAIANFYANELAKECHYSLIAPSVFHKHFIRGVSKNGVIGEAKNDVRDLYEFMKFVRDYLKANNNLSFDSYSLMGYSLGALTSAHLAKLDNEQRVFNFQKVLLINTPVDLQYAMKTIDSYKSNLHNWRNFRKYKELARLGKNIVTFRGYVPNNISFINFRNRISHLSEFEKRAIVGKGLSDVLPGAIKHGQKTMFSIYNQSLRLNSSKSYSFNTYFSKIFLPFKKFTDPTSILTISSLNSQNSLKAVETFLYTSNHVYLMHNEDDFLLRQTDIPYLIEIFKGRMYVYPRGGHMGNMWFKQNLDDMKAILSIK